MQTISDVLLHCKKGPTRIQLEELKRLFEVDNTDQLIFSLTKLKIKVISMLYCRKPYEQWILEEAKGLL